MLQVSETYPSLMPNTEHLSSANMDCVSTMKSSFQPPISHHNFSSLRKKDASQPEQEHPLKG